MSLVINIKILITGEDSNVLTRPLIHIMYTSQYIHFYTTVCSALLFTIDSLTKGFFPPTLSDNSDDISDILLGSRFEDVTSDKQEFESTVFVEAGVRYELQLFLEPVSVFSECTCKGCLPITEMPARQYENMLVVLQMNVFVKNTKGMGWLPHTYPKCYDSQTHTKDRVLLPAIVLYLSRDFSPNKSCSHDITEIDNRQHGN